MQPIHSTSTHSSSLDILVILLARVRCFSIRSTLPDFCGLLVLLIPQFLRSELNLSRLFGDSWVVLVLDVVFGLCGHEDVCGLWSVFVL
jgi:hypothetical protein